MSYLEEFINKYNLVVDQSKSYGKVVYIRSSIHTEEEAELFVKKFSQKTQTIWTIQYGNYRPKKVIFHKSYVCHRSDRKNRNLHKNVKCGARLDVKVKKVNRSTWKNDTFLRQKQPLPCIIRIDYEHNHDCKEDLKFIRLPDEIKDLFYGYFDNGFGVAKALRQYVENLTNNEGSPKSTICIPSTRQIYYIHEKWLKKKRTANVVCEDSKDYLATVEAEELINAIPHVDPPISYLKKPVKPQNIMSESSNKSLPVGLNNVQSMPVTQRIPPNMPQLKNFIAHSRMINSNSTLPKIYIVKRPMQNQYISVNSPNHLNGSVLTVVNSCSGVPLIPSYLNTQASAAMPQVSTVVPQISSVVSLEANTGSSLSSVPISLTENNSRLPSASSSLSHNMSSESCGDSPGPSSILPDYPKLLSEIKVEDLSEDSEQNMPVLTPNIECSSSSNLVNKNSDLSSNTDKVTTNQFCPPVLQHHGASSSVSCVSSSYVTKSSFSYSQTPTKTSFLENNMKISSTNTQITNTVHQSGAQVSVKSPAKSAAVTIVSAVHLSEPQAKDQLPVNKLIKIKEEPPDDYEDNVMKTETASNLPTIENVLSLNTASSLHKAVALSQIQIETNENGIMETNSFSQLEDILPSASSRSTAPVIEDEDHQFLMSLLPEFRRIPKDAKPNLKSQIQNLILSARLTANRKRSQDITQTNLRNKIYSESKKRRQEINPINKIYHDCRTLPSFPTLK